MLLNPQEESLISQLFFEEFKAVTYQKEKSNHQIFSFFIFSSSFFLHDCIMISLSLSLSLCQLNILSSSSIQTYKSSKSRNWVTTQNIFTWLKVFFFFSALKDDHFHISVSPAFPFLIVIFMILSARSLLISTIHGFRSFRRNYSKSLSR